MMLSVDSLISLGAFHLRLSTGGKAYGISSQLITLFLIYPWVVPELVIIIFSVAIKCTELNVIKNINKDLYFIINTLIEECNKH
jgi:hypothetical protein